MDHSKTPQGRRFLRAQEARNDAQKAMELDRDKKAAESVMSYWKMQQDKKAVIV